MREKGSIRHWLLFAATLGLAAGGIGAFMNCPGIIFPSIIKEFGFRSGDLSVYYTIRFLVQARTVGFMTKFTSAKPKAAILVMGLSGFLGFALMIFYTKLWQWYVSAFFAGISMCCVFAVIPIVINNWFKKLNGLLIGIAMSASGGAGAILSPVISRVVTAAGWKTAAVTLGAIGAALMIIPGLLWWKNTPREAGLMPFGRQEGAWLDTGNTDRSEKVTARPPVYVFAVASASIVASILTSQFMNQIALFASSLSYTLAVGAQMASFCMIGNLLGKVIFGALADRIGVFKTSFTILTAAAAAFLLLLFCQFSVAALCAGCCLFGVSFSMGTTAPSLLYLKIYGDTDYKTMLSRHMAVSNLITAFLSSAIPYIYDFTGSFNPVFMLALAANILAFAGFIFLNRYTAKQDG